MVISDEIRFPRPAVPVPSRPGKKTAPVDGVTPVARISAFKRDWSRSREEEYRRPGKKGPPQADRSVVRHLVEKVNSHLAMQNISLHLVLAGDASGYAIDVYDCTESDRCSIVGDLVIDPGDLPLLLRKLEQETGLLLDTVS